MRTVIKYLRFCEQRSKIKGTMQVLMFQEKTPIHPALFAWVDCLGSGDAL